MGARPPVPARRPRDAARPGRRCADDGADARLGLGPLELAGHLGLGLPARGDERSAPGQPERAVEALLPDTPKNRYRANGHNHQRPGLTIDLPGNGGLLAEVAMMAAGWDGAPAEDAYGFPRDGSFTVRWEGLRRPAIPANALMTAMRTMR